jgi:hypothetical protein
MKIQTIRAATINVTPQPRTPPRAAPGERQPAMAGSDLLRNFTYSVPVIPPLTTAARLSA